MAAKKRKAKGGGKPAKAQKPAKQKKEKEPKEIKPGPPVESVMIVATGLMLIVAIFMLDYVKGKHYGEGMMFADSYGASE